MDGVQITLLGGKGGIRCGLRQITSSTCFNIIIKSSGYREKVETMFAPFNGRFRFAADCHLKLDVIELDAFHVLRLL